MRERDIRNAIMDALRATGEFDTVTTGKEGRSEITPGGRSFAHVDPHLNRDRDRWDSAPDNGGVVTSSCWITLVVWEDDVQIRDDRLEKLLNVAQNALNNQSLAGLTIPAYTRFHSWRWFISEYAIRFVEGAFEFRYLIDSFQEFGTEE